MSDTTAEYLAAGSPARVPAGTVLASIGGVWACYFVLTTIRAAIGLEMQGELLWRRVVVCLIGMAITIVIWLVLRLFERRALWIQGALASLLALPASMMIAQANISIFAPVQEQVESKIAEKRGFSLRRDQAGNVVIEAPRGVHGADADGPLGPDDAAAGGRVILSGAVTDGSRLLPVIDLALSRFFLFIAWAALYLALAAIGRAREAEWRGERFRTAARASELRSLRYQVNPHFLFNALNSLSSLVMTGKSERAEEMIQGLAQFYRHSLADGRTGDVDLAEEIALQRDYLSVEALRFPERLSVEIDLPDELAGAQVPGMILQPLVENSVRYAVAPVSRPVRIRIAARSEYGRLVITVSDDGPGLAAGAGHGFGIGLANVRDRLAARYGADATFVSGPVEGGYRSELRLPLEAHD